MLAIEIALIFVLPSLIFVSFDLSSLAFGLILASVFVFVRTLANGIRRTALLNKIIQVFPVILVVCVWASLSLLVEQNPKALTAIPLLGLIGVALVYSEVLEKMDVDSVVSAFYKFSIVLTIVGWAGLFRLFNFGPYSENDKSIFPFSEYSHFSLALGFCIFSIGPQLSAKKLFFVIANALIFAFALPSLTLLLFCILCLIQNMFRIPFKAVMAPAAMSALLIFTYFQISDIEYFSGRLDLQSDSNATTLVWIQGLDIASSNINRNFGLGLGFQGLGSASTIFPEVAHRIYAISGDYLNIEDGGFLSAKITAEFGWVGALFIIFYILTIARYVYRMSFAGSLQSVKSKDLVLLQMIVALAVEMFFRGYGYFSPGVFFAMVAWFALGRERMLLRNILK